MSNEINSEMNEMNASAIQPAEAGAVELSEQDLDAVSGGLGISFGDVDSFFQKSGNFFSQKNLSVDQATFAGPNGSGTMSSVDFQEIISGASQEIGIG